MANFACVLAFLCCASALVDDTGDQAAVERLIAEFNAAPASRRAAFFTSDANGPRQLQQLSDLDRELSGGRPWSEVSTPQIHCRSVRFITPDVALVDAENTQYGSVILVRRVPVLFVVRNEHGAWRIAALRIMDRARAR